MTNATLAIKPSIEVISLNALPFIQNDEYSYTSDSPFTMAEGSWVCSNKLTVSC
jgi:hypothetical protein